MVAGDGMRRRAVRSAGIMVFAQVTGFAVQIIATVVLARLLMPADFGLVTMVTTFSVLVMSFGQIGFPEAVLQREDIDAFLASNLFWINVTAGLILTIAFAGAGSLLAKFYHEPRVAHVAVGVSLAIFITSASVLHLALLKRAMRFAAISANDIVSRFVSVVVPIVLAFAGWGYWALVAGVVAQPLSQCIGAWLICRWTPSLPRRAHGTEALVRFALHVNGRYNVGYFAQNMDNLLVGWKFGPGSLGFYKKAYDLFVLPANQLLSIYPVAVSTLSRLNKDPAQYRRYLVGGLSVLALVGMGTGAELTLIGKDLVLLVLGPKWALSGRIFTLFGPGIGLMLIYSTHGMIHLSIGTTGRYFRWGIVEFVVTGMLFLVALPWGPAGIAAAWTTSYWILTIPGFWYAGKPIDFGIDALIAAIWRFLLASALAGGVCYLIVQRIPWLIAVPGAIGAFARIAATSLLFLALYAGAVILLHGGYAPLKQFAGLLREMSPWEKFSRHAPADEVDPDFDGEVVLAASGPATLKG